MGSKKTEGGVFSAPRPAAANFAGERSKKRRKPSDPLEYDVMRAEALGYGCHYGKYKADHPNTRAEYESMDGPQKVQKTDPGKKLRACPCCGEKFVITATNANKTYCSDDCRKKAEIARKKGRGSPLYCVWCGGEIPRGSHRTRYCCADHYHAAERDREKKRREATENATG